MTTTDSGRVKPAQTPQEVEDAWRRRMTWPPSSAGQPLPLARPYVPEARPLERPAPSAAAAVLREYRRHRRAGESPYGAMHVVRDIYAHLVCDALAACDPVPAEFLARWQAANGYLATYHRRGAWWWHS